MQTLINIPQTFMGPPPSFILELRSPYLLETLCVSPLENSFGFDGRFGEGPKQDPFPAGD